MKDWFESLNPRERILVTTAGGLAVLVVLYLAIAMPLMSAADRTGQRVADKQLLLEEIRAFAARNGPVSPGSGSAGSGQSLVVIIDRTARASGLGSHLKRNQPDGDGALRLRLEDAPFDNLVGWLAELETQHGVRVNTASFDRAGATGRVNCSLRLTRGG